MIEELNFKEEAEDYGLNDQGCHREQVLRLTGHPACSIPRCLLQETSAALNLAAIFSVS